MCATAYSGFQSVAETTKQDDASRAILMQADLALSALVEQQNAVRGFVATHDPSFLKRNEGFETDFDAATAALSRLYPDADAQAKIRKIESDAAIVKSEQDDLIALSRDPRTAEEAAKLILTRGRLIQCRADLKAIVSPEQALLVTRAAAQAAATRSASLTLVVGGLLTILLAVAMGWLLSRSIAAPVSLMTTAMGRLATGDTEVVVPAIGRKDEVGRMANAVQVFKTNAIEKVALERAATADREAAEAQRQAAEALRARHAQDLALVVESLGGGLAKLSSGDLTYRINQNFAQDYKKLGDDFNLAVKKLQETMATVIGRTQGLRANGAEITQASNDLSKRTEQQAASLEQTAAALNVITTTVGQTAEGALEARSVVADAKVNAQNSVQIVRDAIDAMTRIEDSSRQIGQIIGVIDEIAFQTNLLALNAGVEAARAGDAGRGFAVVASEVRALAQRSAEAAREIKTLISTSTQQVAQGVDRVGATGKVLERIATQVSQINGVVNQIAASAQDQATSLHEVNTAVNVMDQVTQQNAAMVEQATAAAHALHEATDDLFNLIGQFTVGKEMSAAIAA
jgi:methyl-accepting chemotaxis protein